MRSKNTAVLKFGGSVIHSQKDFKTIASEIQRFLSEGYQVIVVVSAYHGVTEKLIASASEISTDPSSGSYAELVSSGEFESGLDLTKHLTQSGVNASFRTPAEFDFIATGTRESAAPLSIDSSKISAAFDQYSVVVMPGFSAIDQRGDRILLGRGGSDISAVVIAEALGLDSVRLLKDVDGIYDIDPNKFSHAERFDYVDYQLACKIGSVLIQPEAIQFAATKNISIDIAAIGNSFASRIGPKTSSPISDHMPMEYNSENKDQPLSL
jgi:homoserine dehydrogenase